MKINIIAVFTCLLLAGCMTSNFTLTGKDYSPLPDDAPVKVELTGDLNDDQYEEIGALQVKQSSMDNLSKAVKFAKKKARAKGGDIIYLVNSNSKIALNYQSGGTMTERTNYIFIVGKLKR